LLLARSRRAAVGAHGPAADPYPCDGPRGEQGARPTRRCERGLLPRRARRRPRPSPRGRGGRSGPADQAPSVTPASRPDRRSAGAGCLRRSVCL